MKARMQQIVGQITDGMTEKGMDKDGRHSPSLVTEVIWLLNMLMLQPLPLIAIAVFHQIGDGLQHKMIV